LILGNFNGPLQPEYCSVVPVGEDYTSIGDIVRQYNALIKLDSTAHLDKDESNLIAMEKCLSQFLILSWLHKRHPNIFHSKTLDSNYKCEEKSVQFLIHPSGLNDEHQIFKDSMDDCLKDFQKYMESEKDQHEFLNQFFKPAYLIVLSKYSSNIKSFLEQDSEKLDCWNYVKNLINSTDKLKVKLVNDRERSNLRSQSNPEPLVPVSPSQWEKADAWVLIGGNILGRGLTIPHLVITLFLRNPRNPNFDTSVQQMRFCGYRKSYLPAIQVFAPEDIVEDYYDAVLIDEPFRARALKWDKSSRNLLKEPPISRFIAPSNTRFRPTRNSVLSGEIAVRDSIGQSGFFKLAKIANPLDFVNNMNIIIDLIKDKSIYEKYSNAETVSKIYLLSELDIRYLFLNWQINKLEMPDFMTMFELLGYDEKERGLSHLECLISIDEKIQKFPSGEEAHQNFNLFEVPERTINSKISEFDWKNFNNLEKLNSVEIKQVVGDSERKMRNDFSDKVFLQCRLYKLLNPSDVRLGIGSRNPIGRGVGLGISMIGWIPNTQEEFYINQEVGRNFVQ
jgi:hypothetical protein